MEKMKMHSMNKIDENVRKLAELFPECVTEIIKEINTPPLYTQNKVEQKLTKAIDFDVLRSLLSNNVVEGNQERYQFTWPDKSKARALVNQEVTSTLRPCREESVNFDTTENLYIEGDNLEVLKLLQETYLGKIKMIYIDPPYNTSHDFIYKDDFSQSADEYSSNSGQYDEHGNRLVANTESNGRFHTDWLNMMYPRLRLAKDLLSDDGAIFISIDENEESNLKKICNEIFGEQNFVGNVIWERAFSPKNDAKYFSDSHDYILVYARQLLSFGIGLLPRTEEANSRYSNPDNDPRGPWTADNLTVKTYSAIYDYPITTPSGKVVRPTNGRCWNTSQERMQALIDDNRVWFGADGSNTPRLKRFLSDVQQGMTPITIWKYQDVGHNQEGRQEVKKLFDGKGYFDGPKPLRLMERILQIANTDKDSIILDFFSGSATTAHAVMKLNAKDEGHRKFIMIQVAEPTNPEKEAYKDGYKDICEIGKERIRRAGKQILDELKEKNGRLLADEISLDIGFRDLKLDSSNMNDIYYTPEAFSQDLVDSAVSNIKEDRTAEDLLFQVMLDLGIFLSSKIEEEEIAGKKIFNVADNHLIACFDEDVNEDVIIEVAKKKPTYFVMRDLSLANDSVSVNFDQIFARYSPDTIRKVI